MLGDCFLSFRFVFLSVSFLPIYFFLIFANSLFAEDKKVVSNSHKKKNPKLIVLSIDGFPGYYFDSPEILELIPNLKAFSERSSFSNRIRTVNPTVTYPSHTSMVTGTDPAQHGIYNNTLVDPFERNDGGWMWYAEDIAVPSLWDFASKKGLKTGNVFWPVTVGAGIDYNLPQIWRKRIQEDNKLLRVLSTKGLHKEAELSVGEPLNDVTKDSVKFKTGVWLWEKYSPDLMFLYTTDLDSSHHAYGPFSDQAKEKLKQIDSLFGEFIKSIRLYERDDLALILISDHGFHSADKICSPNLYLLNKGWIQQESSSYDLIFKSSGGSAILLPGKKNFLSEEEKISIGNDLETNCPGAEWRAGEEDLKFLRKTQHPNALGYLYTKEKIYFSGTRKGELFSSSKSMIHGHGYENTNPEMKTIGGVYWKGTRDETKWKMHSVKDVFVFSCRLLDLECK